MADGDPGPIVATAPFRDAPRGGAALVIIDMITEMDFGVAGEMLAATEAAADAVLRLRAQADAAGLTVIYVNDNFGEWHSERARLIDRALAGGSRGRAIAERLVPRDGDYFVIKPQFSGFYSTNLPVLLPKLGVDRLILTGISADICVLFTAGDAHMRDYRLWVPEDAVASRTAERRHWALEIMKNAMRAEVRPTSALSIEQWLGDDDAGEVERPSRAERAEEMEESEGNSAE